MNRTKNQNKLDYKHMAPSQLNSLLNPTSSRKNRVNNSEKSKSRIKKSKTHRKFPRRHFELFNPKQSSWLEIYKYMIIGSTIILFLTFSLMLIEETITVSIYFLLLLSLFFFHVMEMVSLYVIYNIIAIKKHSQDQTYILEDISKTVSALQNQTQKRN